MDEKKHLTYSSAEVQALLDKVVEHEKIISEGNIHAITTADFASIDISKYKTGDLILLVAGT